MCDIYDALLFISKRASKFISNWHTRIYLHAPKIFSSGYEKAEEKDDLFREGTPVYKYITSGADRMYDYIVSGGYDNVICTHVFPALALTEVRRRHPDLRVTTSHVSTDYTCSPCTADSKLDWYFMPSARLKDEFVQCGIPEDKLVASGMPVRKEFYVQDDKAAAKKALGIEPSQTHLLMMCGSMGCGPMEEITEVLRGKMRNTDVLSVACSKNETLLKKLTKLSADCPNIRILGQIDDVPKLMQATDVFLTKPGGLSTSEAAASGLPMVLIDAVAGCEEHNLDYFLRAEGFLADQRQPQRALARVVGHGVGHQIDLQLLRQLIEYRRLADARRSHEKKRPLMHEWHAERAIRRSFGIGKHRAPDFFLCLFYIHPSSLPGLSASSTSRIAQRGMLISS